LTVQNQYFEVKVYLNRFSTFLNPLPSIDHEDFKNKFSNINVLKKNPTFVEISPSIPTRNWRVIGQTAVLGLSLFLAGTWIGKLMSEKNLTSLQTKEIHAQDTFDSQIGNKIKEIQILEQNLKEKIQQVEIVKDKNSYIENLLLSTQEVKDQNKYLTNQTQILKQRLKEKNRQFKILTEEHVFARNTLVSLNNEFGKILIPLTECERSIMPLKDIEKNLNISRQDYEHFSTNGRYTIIAGIVGALAAIGLYRQNKNQFDLQAKRAKPLF